MFLSLQICCLLAYQSLWLCWWESSSPSSSLCSTGGVIQCTQLMKYINNLHHVHINTEEILFIFSAYVSFRNQILNSDEIDQSSALDLFDCKMDVRKQNLVTCHLLTSQITDCKNMCFPLRAFNMELSLTFPSLTNCMIHRDLTLTTPGFHLMLSPG